MAPLAFLALAACATGVQARRGAAPPAVPPNLVEHLLLPPIDPEALLEQDEKDLAQGGVPLRYAAPFDLRVGPSTAGEWEEEPDGSRIWRLRVRAPYATDLNFGFGRFALPAGAALWVSSDAESDWEGPYTAADNEAHGELWTPVVPGDRATITLLLPAGAGDAPDLELTRIGRGYRDLLGRLGEPRLPKSGGCNNDVICPEGDPWRSEIDSVAVYSTGGATFCTGQMIMDVPRSFRNWFLTANHCGIRSGNAPSLVVYWNYQASACGGPRDGSLDQNQTGSTFRARAADSDFCLLELDDDPDPAFHVYYAGWDATDSPAQATVGIHHPSTDEKAITFNEDPITRADNCISGGVDTHWYITEYEDGTTEGGSSGSGLWDADSHLLIGTLSGGQASCSRPDEYDCYGRFGVAWDRGGSADARLKDWLDPGDTGERMVPGSYASATTRLISSEGADACPLGAGDGNGLWEPGEQVQLTIELEGTGALSGVSGVLTSSTPGVRVSQGDSTWPDLSPGTPRANDGPAFGLDLFGVGCYETIDLRLSVTTNEGGPFVHDFQHAIGIPLSPDVPMTIVDNGDMTSDLVVTDSLIPTSLAVRVVLTHTWVGDLRLRLRAPDGREVLLLDRPNDGVGGFCDNNDMDVRFDDASLFDAENHCADTQPWLVGDAFPVEALSPLLGTDVAGTWSLIIEDNARGDDGTLTWWELITEPPLEGTCLPCGIAPCDGVEIALTDLRVTKAAGGQLQLGFSGPDSACAEGVQVRLAAEARPALGGGSFPDDPSFRDVSAEDLDPGALFRHVPPAGDAYYLVVEALPGGGTGPSGHYAN